MDDTILRSGDLIVTPVVTELHLAKAYIRMAEDGTIGTVFYQSIPSLRDFLAEYMTEGRRVTLGCFREIPGSEPEFCGLGWVYAPEKMGGFVKAETGMCFFRRQTGKHDNLKFGRLMLEMFFSRYPIDVIFGTTPEPNKLALRYAQKLGFSLHGPIPRFCSWQGRLESGWISQMARSEWIERNLPPQVLIKT